MSRFLKTVLAFITETDFFQNCLFSLSNIRHSNTASDDRCMILRLSYLTPMIYCKPYIESVGYSCLDTGYRAEVSNTRPAGRMRHARAFCAARDEFWDFQ